MVVVEVVDVVVVEDHRKPPLKFCQNRVRNSLDVSNIEFMWVDGASLSV